jgi:hypothetical protein
MKATAAALQELPQSQARSTGVMVARFESRARYEENTTMAHRPEIEAFRARLKQPEKNKKINWQQWVGSPTAWLALMLSASSFFYTFLYHSDELSVVMGDPTIKPDKDAFKIIAPRSMTFINSGSRPVTVISARLILVQGHPHSVECGDSVRRDITTEFPLIFEQTVVKPFDAVSRSMSFENKEESFPKAGINEGGGQASVLVCVRFELAATDAARWRKTVLLGLQLGSRDPFAQLRQGRFDTTPKYLMKRNRFWTEVDRDSR